MSAHVRALVLDATPLITQSYAHYQNYAETFYTTPTVFHEIKDEQARKNLETWQSLGTLKLIHPSEESIAHVSAFARLTGDYSVLSANDIHIIALEYQLECQLNGGDWRLRQKPGDSIKESQEKEASIEAKAERQAATPTGQKKRRRRGGKKQREKKEQRELEETVEKAEPEETNEPEEPVEKEVKFVEEEVKQQEQPATIDESEESTLVEDFVDGDDDGEWITPDTLVETMIRDSGEDTSGSNGVVAIDNDSSNLISLPRNQVALATGDFAVQNVALQMNMNLMNFMSGLKIKRLRNYMLRCHACFRIFPLPKDGKPKHFCPSCGGQGTLLRCAVSVDAQTGAVTPHLKANFQWNNRGNIYSMASPLSKNSQKKYGKKGYVHNKQNSNHMQDTPLLREDQKEYQQMVKQDEWTRRHNEKVLDNWIGGGSADNYMSPFAMSGLKHHSYKVGRGRYANSNKKK
ncbi:similar to Saccharomyces cerevisiae YOR056C NOB1 Essential nuclear protein involved in proteasome maturation and synthesis of 40S ribosomal subunits [Maudiozyma barnettii]|uniref:20S-pre-rRNA D-site endonuclease NOB1 n=1 Tax=Maudiozyma barnettii TaxID=61262 RepID=A0A8H2ZIL1_9SACH|nr:rRNA-binding endoribonuclease [Kazachstania barnettii]CAB4256028.1 similar to Saccharomyces cerevisiae YOR056C NOB1 Essential nuclear protein involved in proteasome maturation and synthesis of 40S ribosomal subunits [Kazachstania barnettii]CAD1784636.1 similar to Saccharomyces cerevisiae YOR056C NOB1 Essential nuclear protein involved in proteasome maturation and synthesis of 40S ribosomal subunits [Kazachstania barnettii]